MEYLCTPKMANKPLYSHLAETLIASEIVKLGGIIKEKIRNGEKIFNFTIGDFDSSLFPIPAGLREAIVEAYTKGYTTYPAAEGELDLRSAISTFIKAQLDLDYSPSEILVSNGGRPLIYAIYRCIVDKGDKVIYPVPSWNNNHYTHFTEGEHILVSCDKENNFMPTAEQLAPHIKDATLLALCSPLNPTGTVFGKEQLEAICDLIIEENLRRPEGAKKLFLLYDQIYWTLTFGDTKHFNPVTLRPAMKPYTVFVDGISKAFAATGVRVGWTMGPESLLQKIKAVNSHIGSWAPMAEQKATAKFLNNHQAVNDFLSQIKNEVYTRLQGLYDGFIELKNAGFPVDAIRPQAAIYLTVQIDLKGRKNKEAEILTTQEDVTDYLLNKAKLAMVPFGFFGADRESNWYRISVGCCKTEEIPQVINNLKLALTELL